MTDPAFENNFDDLLHQPSTNTISDSLSNVDVSNPFSDAISPQSGLVSISESEDEGNNAVFSTIPIDNGDPLEHGLGFTNDTSAVFRSPIAYKTGHDRAEFEDVDVSSVKGIAAISPPYNSYVHDSYNGDYSYDEHIAPYRDRINQQLLNQEDDEIVRQISESIDDDKTSDLRIPEPGEMPSFEVFVEDPRKIGDPINAHTIYKIRTKTNSNAFKGKEFTVLRRYRDFIWLYNQLTLGNPGVIVPPIPEKHAIGRFQEEFIEHRRQSLEKCLNKIVSHPMLYGDPDLKLFLESDTFILDLKKRQQEEPRGVLRSLGEAVSTAAALNKFIETDEWFENRKNQLTILEGQLKVLQKSVDAMVKQRKELGISTMDLGTALLSLAEAETNKTIINNVKLLSEVQQEIKELHEKQAQKDVCNMQNILDEYVRTTGSIKIAFTSRAKAHQTWQYAISELQKKKASYERVKSQGASQDRVSYLLEEVAEAEHRVEDCKHEFEDVSKLIKAELDRFDKEKVEDLKTGIESLLESTVQTQKKIIALWESYLAATEKQEDDIVKAEGENSVVAS
ncbi:9427_t:CDS:10 [Paraglomus occultum]|uniref:9427_t:CDS:1 n=1 Tax=Paraglomus occultum TaxID=144539 RepID=A0A9N9A162_9GLOM|nr:9427_t:CDS:10 [Paraglomus occultum]